MEIQTEILVKNESPSNETQLEENLSESVENKPNKFKCQYCDKCFTFQQSKKMHEKAHEGIKPYKCQFCDKDFLRNSYLVLHVRTHTGERPFKCKLCDKCFANSSHLRIHERTKHNINHQNFNQPKNLLKPKQIETVKKRDLSLPSSVNREQAVQPKEVETSVVVDSKPKKQFECQYCRKTFGLLDSKKRHEKTHEGIKPYKCQFCDKAFLRNSYLVLHIRTHTGERPFKCKLCDKCFASSSHFRNHERTKHNIIHQNFIQRKNPLKPKQIETVKKRFDCNSEILERNSTDEICVKHAEKELILKEKPTGIVDSNNLKPFAGERELGHNLQLEDELTISEERTEAVNTKKRFVCNYCGKTFGNLSNKNVHEINHTGEKTLKCCDEYFIHQSKLKRHERTHTGEQPYACKVCGKKSGSVSDLNVHQKRHSGAKPTYQCTICLHVFASDLSLKNHRRLHLTKRIRYPCKYCGKTFGFLHNKNTHQKSHTGEKTFKCRFCDKYFVYQSKCKSHERIHTMDTKLNELQCLSTSSVLTRHEKELGNGSSPNLSKNQHKFVEDNTEIMIENLISGEETEGDTHVNSVICYQQLEEAISITEDPNGASNLLPTLKKHEPAPDEKPYESIPNLCENLQQIHTELKDEKKLNSDLSSDICMQRLKEAILTEAPTEIVNYIEAILDSNSNDENRDKHTEKDLILIENPTGIVDSNDPKLFAGEGELVNNLHLQKELTISEERTEIVDTKQQFACNYCGKTFGYLNNKIAHEKNIHMGEKPFKCKFCDKYFTHQSRVIAHERTHTGEKPYACKICGLKFITSSSMKRHESTHAGAKPYQCTTCLEFFESYLSLKEHKRLHLDKETGFSCKYCGKTFGSLHNKTTHEKYHTGEKPFKCRFCDTNFVFLSKLKNHERIHTRETKLNELQPLSTSSVLLRRKQTHGEDLADGSSPNLSDNQHKIAEHHTEIMTQNLISEVETEGESNVNSVICDQQLEEAVIIPEEPNGSFKLLPILKKPELTTVKNLSKLKNQERIHTRETKLNELQPLLRSSVLLTHKQTHGEKLADGSCPNLSKNQHKIVEHHTIENLIAEEETEGESNSNSVICDQKLEEAIIIPEEPNESFKLLPILKKPELSYDTGSLIVMNEVSDGGSDQTKQPIRSENAKRRRVEAKRRWSKKKRVEELGVRSSGEDKQMGVSNTAADTPTPVVQSTWGVANMARRGKAHGASRVPRRMGYKREQKRKTGANARQRAKLPSGPRSFAGLSWVPTRFGGRGPQTPSAKRQRPEKNVPPAEGRPNKRPKPATGVKGAGTAHVSPLLRDEIRVKTPEGENQDTSIPKKELQVVLRSKRPGGTIEPAEADALRQNIVEVMLEAMESTNADSSGPELHFRNSELVDPGWFLVMANDEASRDWLLSQYRPPTVNGIDFQAMLAMNAPWPEKIGFWLQSKELDLERVVKTVRLQNRQLAVGGWKLLGKEGGPGGWHLTFSVERAVAKSLEAAGWTVFYELMTLPVRRIMP